MSGIYFANVGHWPHREWDDSRKYGFIAAGYGRRFSSQLNRLSVGSLGAAYLNGSGYVGIARAIALPVPVRNFRYRGRPLRAKMLKGPELLHDIDDDEKCEYLVEVEWIKQVALDEAKFRRKAGIFVTKLIVASLASQVKTIQFLQEEFKVDFDKLLSTE